MAIGNEEREAMWDQAERDAWDRYVKGNGECLEAYIKALDQIKTQRNQDRYKAQVQLGIHEFA